MNTTTPLVSNSNKSHVMYWSAIVAGLVMAIVAGVLLNLLAVGLGLVALPLSKNGFAFLGIGVVLVHLLSGTLAMFLGGWTSGFFSHTCGNLESLMYGAVTWAVATIMAFMLSLWGLGAFVGGASSLIATSLKAVDSESVELIGKPALQLIEENEREITLTIQEQVNALLEGSGEQPSLLNDQQTGQSIQKLKRETSHVLKKLSKNNVRFQFMREVQKWIKADGATADQARAKIKELLVKHTELSEEEVERIITDWQDYYQSVKKYTQERSQKAKKEVVCALEKTSAAFGSLALALSLMLILGLAASVYGSRKGAQSQCLDNYMDLQKRI